MFRQALSGKLTPILLLSLGVILCSLAGCGQKGKPLPPADEQDTFPGQYPKPD